MSKQTILSRVIDLVIARGPHGFTRADLCKEAGVVSGALNRHWKKEDARPGEPTDPLKRAIRDALMISWETVNEIAKQAALSFDPEDRKHPATFVSKALETLFRRFLEPFRDNDEQAAKHVLFVMVYYRDPSQKFDEHVLSLNGLLDDILTFGQAESVLVADIPISAMRESLMGAFLELVSMRALARRLPDQSFIDYTLRHVLSTMEALVSGFAADNVELSWRKK